jgi:hypothetical protein
LTTSFIADDIASWLCRSAEPGGAARGGRFGGEARLDEAIDEGEQRAESIARRADAEGAHERRIQTRDVRLDHAMRDARREQVQPGSCVHGAVARLVRRQRGVLTEVSPDE